LAYEMAVCIIEVDGHRNPLEEQFLAELAGWLRLAPEQVVQPLQLADQISRVAVLPVVVAPSAPPREPPLPNPNDTQFDTQC